jgi:hypothetical protein
MRRWQARKVARVWGRARNCEWRDLPRRSGVLSELGGAREMSVPGCRQVHMRPASDRPGREWCDSGSIQGKPPGYLPRRGGVLDVRGARSPVQRAVAKVHLRSERRAALSQRGVTLSWSTSVRDYCERTGPGLSPPMSLATSLFCLRCWSRFVAGGMPAATTSPVWVLSSWVPRGPGLVCVSRPGDPRSGRSGCWSHSRVYLQLPVACAASLPAVTGFDRGQLRAWLRGAVSTGQRLVPTDILNGSIGYVPALGVMYLVALLALLRARTERPPTHLPAWGTQGTGNARGKLEGYYWRHRPCSRRCSCYDRLILPPAGPFLSGPISFGTCSMPGCSSA